MAELMSKSRRGEQERGFSMMLGTALRPARHRAPADRRRTGPDGSPVAMCQFVPSPAIGGYSLDLMRRDPGRPPQRPPRLRALLDDHLRSKSGLTRAQPELRRHAFRPRRRHRRRLTQRVERWAIRRLSGVLQIESLWRFNAKYEPRWLPRYIVFDSAEQFVPVAVQIMRAESLTEVPVIGRLLTTGTVKRSGPAVPEEVVAAMGQGVESNGRSNGTPGATEESEAALAGSARPRDRETESRT